MDFGCTFLYQSKPPTIDEGANVNQTRDSDKLTPLMLSSSKGNLSIAKMLLRQKGIKLDFQNISGETALHLAVQNSHTQIVKLLLKNGAKVNQRLSNGKVELHLAIEIGSVEIVKLLLKANDIKVDQEDFYKNTPYAIAKSKGHFEIQKALEAKGADTDRRTSAIIGTMKKLGYEVNEGGFCYGIAYTGIQSFLRGEGEKFLRRVERIQNYGYKDSVRRILKKKKENLPLVADSKKMTDEEKEDLDLRAFFDSITMYFNGAQKNIPNYSTTQDWRREFSLFNTTTKYQEGSKYTTASPLWLNDMHIKYGILTPERKRFKNLSHGL